MFRLLIFVYISFLFFKKIYQVVQKIRETHISVDKHFFEVQIADKSYEKRQGLMFIKKKLKSNQGMLFVYEDNYKPSLWMKNTFIPLDAIFLDKNGKVTDLIENMKPKSTETRQTEIPCKYVLEVNANTIKKNNIKIGDYVGTTLLTKNITKFDTNKLKNSLGDKNNENNKSKNNKSKNNKTKK